MKPWVMNSFLGTISEDGGSSDDDSEENLIFDEYSDEEASKSVDSTNEHGSSSE